MPAYLFQLKATLGVRLISQLPWYYMQMHEERPFVMGENLGFTSSAHDGKKHSK